VTRGRATDWSPRAGARPVAHRPSPGPICPGGRIRRVAQGARRR